MNKFIVFTVTTSLILIATGILYISLQKNQVSNLLNMYRKPIDEGGEVVAENPLSIEYMQKQEYPGSDITIEQKLDSGENYQRFIASYKSDGLKIYGLLTIPDGDAPQSGWPAIVFNHGYIPPNEYRTTERYVDYVDAFARNGYVVFKIDYRGHGNSEGEAVGGYGSPAYTIDALNAFSSLQKYESVDPNRIGMWGHSMGGMVTLRSMVINPNIKASVIWSGVVGSYQDLLNNWRHASSYYPSPTPSRRSSWRVSLQNMYGTPEQNQAFWDSISPISYVADLSGPLQLHHTKGDESVPYQFSQTINQRIQEVGKVSQLYLYEGDNHNISDNFSLAMSRSVDFFNTYLKGGE